MVIEKAAHFFQMLVPIISQKTLLSALTFLRTLHDNLCINFVNLDVQIFLNAQFCAKNLTKESKNLTVV
jgi:hypothetical protein